MSCICLVRQVPACDLCRDEVGYIDSGIMGRWGNFCIRCWVGCILERNRERGSIGHPPLLGTGIGQLWITTERMMLEKVTLEQIESNNVHELARNLGNGERYTLLIEDNKFVKAETRQYHEIAGNVGLISGVVDIASRLYPHETDRRANQTKVWLTGKGWS